MNKGFLFFVVTLSLLLAPLSGYNDARADVVYLAGVEDDFAAPADVASPSTILRTVIEYRWKIQDFDLAEGLNDGSSNKWVAHTFFDLPPGIIGATLEFKIQAGDDVVGAPDDDFWLLFYDEITAEFDTNKKIYRVPIGNRGGTTTGLSGIEWEPESEATITLDLSALPLPDGSTINVLESLANYGFLDVLVTDDTAVDYYKLTVYPTTSGDILNFFDDSVDNGELYGRSTNWFGVFQLFIMRMFLERADDMIARYAIVPACMSLQLAYLRCDGAYDTRWDIVDGPAKDDLAEMILDLKANIGCRF